MTGITVEGEVWDFPKLRPSDPQGRNPIFANFKNEGWTEAQTFIREFLQNTLDNRQDEGNGHKKGVVTFRLLGKEDGIDTHFNRACLKSLEPHLAVSGLPDSLRDYGDPVVLVAEEYNTTGLGGPYANSRASGDFAAFFHGEALDTKTGNKNGRAGQGKATYNMISKAGAMMALTVREDDGKTLLMGKALVPRTHQVGQSYYAYRAFWSSWKTDQPVPFDDPVFIGRFKKAYRLRRRQDECGTSFVMPFPDKTLTRDIIVRVVIEDFYYSVLRGRLEVKVDDIVIDETTVLRLVANYAPQNSTEGHEPPSRQFLLFVRDAVELPKTEMIQTQIKWNGTPELPDALFQEDELAKLRTTVEQGGIAWVRLSLDVARADGTKQDSYIDVYLRSAEDIPRTEEAFIRSDLYIAKEKRLKGMFGRAYALVIAEDRPIATFLANAEAASHLNWNGQEERVVERFRDIPRTLRIVRNSARKLIELIKGSDKERDEDLLIDILSIPREGIIKSGKAGGKRKKKVKPPTPMPPLPPAPQYHQISDGDGVRVERGRDPIPNSALPVKGQLEIAYENVAFGGNAFSNYHPFDFDLADPSFGIKAKNLEVLSRDENRVEFEVKAPDFFLEIAGFQPNRQIRARAKLEVQ